MKNVERVGLHVYQFFWVFLQAGRREQKNSYVYPEASEFQKSRFVHADHPVINWGLNSVEVATHLQRAVAATIAATTYRFCIFEVRLHESNSPNPQQSTHISLEIKS